LLVAVLGLPRVANAVQQSGGAFGVAVLGAVF